MSRRVSCPDGLYRVVTPSFVAGFVVEGGELVQCAPILRRRFDYWCSQARRLETSPSPGAECPADATSERPAKGVAR